MFSAVLLCLIFISMVFYIVYPFLQPRSEFTTFNSDIPVLEREKANLLKQLKEAEFEKDMGITAEEDYLRVRSELMQETAQIIEKIEIEKLRDEVVKKNKCINCGSALGHQAKFCTSCGNPLGNNIGTDS